MNAASKTGASLVDPSPQAIDKDLEAGGKLRRSPSRASVPYSRRSSQNLDDLHPDDQTHGDDGDGDDPEFEWGPAHPCFPHLNPHVPLSSPLYQTTRIIRIKRDWMVAGDLAPTFANLYPEVLDPMLTEDAFRHIIRRINDTLLEAFSPWSTRAWVDALVGMATFWLWDNFGFTSVKTKLRELENWIDDWNRTVGEPEGVRIIPLRRTGYLTIDIQIPDPQIEPGRPDTRMTDLANLAHATSNSFSHAETRSHQDPSRDAPQLHGEFGPYPITDLASLRKSGQQHLAPAVGV